MVKTFLMGSDDAEADQHGLTKEDLDWLMVEPEECKDDTGWTILGTVASSVLIGLSRSGRIVTTVASGAVIGVSWGTYLVATSFSIGLCVLSSVIRSRTGTLDNAQPSTDVVVARGEMFRNKKVAIRQMLNDARLSKCSLEINKRVLQKVSNGEAKTIANSVLDKLPTNMQERATLKDVANSGVWKDKQCQGALEVDGKIHYVFWRSDESNAGVDFAFLHVKAPAGYTLVKVLAILAQEGAAKIRGDDELVVAKDVKKD